jgi:hypothetical protein
MLLLLFYLSRKRKVTPSIYPGFDFGVLYFQRERKMEKKECILVMKAIQNHIDVQVPT